MAKKNHTIDKKRLKNTNISAKSHKQSERDMKPNAKACTLMCAFIWGSGLFLRYLHVIA